MSDSPAPSAAATSSATTITAPSGEEVPYGYHKPEIVPKFWRDKYEKEAGRYWDKFYKTHNANFFKDRHWIDSEFEELRVSSLESAQDSSADSSSDMRYALEVGCGVGNTVFPLLETNPKLFFYALDFSPHAISLLKKHPDYISTGRCSGHVIDIVKDPLPTEIAPGSLDLVMMIFVLSAISPQNFDAVIDKLAKAVKVGGSILFRDYAVGDMAQMRFDGKSEAQKLEENFYVRSDGTRAYYFNEQELIDLMAKHGFEMRACRVVDKVIENRKQKSEMRRLWIQGKFERVSITSDSTNASQSS